MPHRGMRDTPYSKSPGKKKAAPKKKAAAKKKYAPKKGKRMKSALVIE